MEEGKYITNLEHRTEKFVCEYLKDFNAARAYRATFPHATGKTPKNNATKYLKRPEVQKMIKNKMDIINGGNIAKATEILEYLTAVLRAKTSNETLYNIGDGVQGKTELRVSEKERLKAAELLAKHYQLFSDVSNVTLNMENVTIVDDLDG